MQYSAIPTSPTYGGEVRIAGETFVLHVMPQLRDVTTGEKILGRIDGPLILLSRQWGKTLLAHTAANAAGHIWQRKAWPGHEDPFLAASSVRVWGQRMSIDVFNLGMPGQYWIDPGVPWIRLSFAEPIELARTAIAAVDEAWRANALEGWPGNVPPQPSRRDTRTAGPSASETPAGHVTSVPAPDVGPAAWRWRCLHCNKLYLQGRWIRRHLDKVHGVRFGQEGGQH